MELTFWYLKGYILFCVPWTLPLSNVYWKKADTASSRRNSTTKTSRLLAFIYFIYFFYYFLFTFAIIITEGQNDNLLSHVKALKITNASVWNHNKVDMKWIIPFSFNSLQWHHTQTQSAHLITARVAPLRWRVYSRDQSRISAGVRKLPIYAPTSLQWVKWIGYSVVWTSVVLGLLVMVGRLG